MTSEVNETSQANETKETEGTLNKYLVYSRWKDYNLTMFRVWHKEFRCIHAKTPEEAEAKFLKSCDNKPGIKYKIDEVRFIPPVPPFVGPPEPPVPPFVGPPPEFDDDISF